MNFKTKEFRYQKPEATSPTLRRDISRFLEQV